MYTCTLNIPGKLYDIPYDDSLHAPKASAIEKWVLNHWKSFIYCEHIFNPSFFNIWFIGTNGTN